MAVAAEHHLTAHAAHVLDEHGQAFLTLEAVFQKLDIIEQENIAVFVDVRKFLLELVYLSPILNLGGIAYGRIIPQKIIGLTVKDSKFRAGLLEA